MKLARHVTTLIALWLIPSAVQSGAWTQAEGRTHLIINSVYYTNDQFFDRDGNLESQPRFDKYEYNPFVEYGVADELTIGASFMMQLLFQETSSTFSNQNTTVTVTGSDYNYGIGNTELFARYRLHAGTRHVLSVQPLIKLPAYYAFDRVPRADSNNFDAELSLLGGYSFPLFGQEHYIDVRVGYRHRFHSMLEDQFRGDIKLGLRLNRRWEIIPALSTIQAINASKDLFFTEDGQNDFDLVKFETMLQYNLNEHMYLQLGGFGHIDGRNVGEGYGAIFSTGFKF